MKIEFALVFIVLSLMFWRCVQPSDPMPLWSGDAFEVANPPVAILPLQSMIMSLVSVGAGFILLAMSDIKLWMRCVCMLLLAAGCAAVKWHSMNPAMSIENTMLGLDWLAAIATGVGVASAIQSERTREHEGSQSSTLLRCALAMLAACVIASLIRGVSQYVFEHARTYASFQQDRAAFFASQGWSEGSPMALAFERRISQREATGWFGMANVFATLMAVSSVCMLMLAAHTKRIGWWVLAGASLVGVVLAGSKAGFGVVAIGLAVAAASGVARKRGWLADRRLLGGVITTALVCAAVWGGLAVRGALGENLGERSLLFRAQYHQAAFAIASNLGQPIDVAKREALPEADASASPPTLQGDLLKGIGPASFKDRAMLVKPATLPEDVSSPHSLPLDLVVGLGVAGAGLLGLWYLLACFATSGLFARASTTLLAAKELPTTGPTAGRDPAWLAVVLACVVPTVAAAWSETSIATLDQRLVRLGSCIIAAFAGVWVLHAMRRVQVGLLVFALAAASAALIAHLLLELTGTMAGANAWCAALLACGAGLAIPARTSIESPAAKPARQSTLPLAIAACVIIVLTISSISQLKSVAAWQRSLQAAYDIAEPVQTMRLRTRALGAGSPMDGDTVDSIARDLGTELGVPVQPRPASVQAALEALHLRQLQPAIEQLTLAHEAKPGHLVTAQALSRLLTLQADAQKRAGNVQASQTAAAKARGVIERVIASGESASAWSWLAQLIQTHRQLLGDSKELRTQQRSALLRASVLSPYELQMPKQLAKFYAENPDEPEAGAGSQLAKQWANRALAVNELLRLDPVKQLGDAARKELQDVAGK
jgi:hypothetical protein